MAALVSDGAIVEHKHVLRERLIPGESRHALHSRGSIGVTAHVQGCRDCFRAHSVLEYTESTHTQQANE